MVVEIQVEEFVTSGESVYRHYSAFIDGRIIFPGDKGYPDLSIGNEWERIGSDGIFYPRYVIYLSCENGDKLVQEYQGLISQGLYENSDLVSLISRYKSKRFNHIGGNVFRTISGDDDNLILFRSSKVRKINRERVMID